MIALAVALGLCVAGGVFAVRFARGPTPYDRILAAHALWSAAALTAATLGVLLQAPTLFDAAIVLVLAEAVLVLAAIKTLRRNSFQPALAPPEDPVAP